MALHGIVEFFGRGHLAHVCPKCPGAGATVGVVRGFLRDGIVYVNEDSAHGASVELRQTVLEELAHYLTESKDCTRDLQDWAFKLAVRVAMVVEPVAG